MASIWSRLMPRSGSRNHIPELLLSTTGDKVWFPGWSKLRPWISWPACSFRGSNPGVHSSGLPVPGYSYGSHTLQRGLYTKWARRTNSSSPRSVANGNVRFTARDHAQDARFIGISSPTYVLCG